MESNNPTKVMLWCMPRTVSTAFLKCMSSIPGTVAFNEPFNMCELLSSIMDTDGVTGKDEFIMEVRQKQMEAMLNEGKKQLGMHSFSIQQFLEVYGSRSYFRGMLEADYDGHKLVICKDMAGGIFEKYQYIPSGYKHTFLIRNPYKMYNSYKALIQKETISLGKEITDIRKYHLFPKHGGYREMHGLWSWIKENMDPNPILIDSDDLINHPEEVLAEYFREIGVPFSKAYCTWDKSTDVCLRWIGMRDVWKADAFDKAIHSSCFEKPLKNSFDKSELRNDVIECAEAAMPMYNEMFETRIRIH